jgi:hypothetical protein
VVSNLYPCHHYDRHRIDSLAINPPAIAESAMSFLTCLMHLAIYTTIFGDVDLSVMQGSCLIDLLFDEI